jgi:hypothetical protein
LSGTAASFTVNEYYGKLLLKTASTNLISFHNSAVPLRAALPYLALQQNLQIYHQADALECDLPSPFLPDVKDIVLPVWIIPHVSSRFLTRIETEIENPDDMAREDEVFAFCASSRGTLTHFMLLRNPRNGSMSSADYFQTVQHNAPLLQEIRVSNHTANDLASYSTP